ncbi:protein iws1 homolog [Stylonychia lemnae]|uniref:Protein iws1 homolog n=1 Tax=Stylonychia lemnae TaxID=5949 RepID=A0A078AY13_STYLE|nr:protein iws1 homolog [Stylonychia lemnae]|eukprot:CDW85673.1 protein iws1 homolog [Stylonychia lemnae]
MSPTNGDLQNIDEEDCNTDHDNQNDSDQVEEVFNFKSEKKRKNKKSSKELREDSLIMVKEESEQNIEQQTERKSKSKKNKKDSKKSKKSKKNKKHRRPVDYEAQVKDESEQDQNIRTKDEDEDNDQKKGSRNRKELEQAEDNNEELEDENEELRRLEEEVRLLQEKEAENNECVDGKQDSSQINGNVQEDQEQAAQQLKKQKIQHHIDLSNQDAITKIEGKKRIEFKNEKGKNKREEKIQRKLEEEMKEQEKLKNLTQAGSSVDNLLRKMQEAVDKDREANRNKKPAISRLVIAQQCYNQLRKMPIQEKFLDQGGCKILADWLDMMPDGTFPNVNLVEGMLNCIDGLRLEVDHLDQSGLGQIIQYYAEGIAKTSLTIQRQAKSIIEKWCRFIYNIKQSYDGDGDHDESYKQYQQRMIKQRKIVKENQDLEKEEEDDDDQEDEDDDTENSNQRKNKNKKYQKNQGINGVPDKLRAGRGFNQSRYGVLLPERMAFDFVRRPERIEDPNIRKKDMECGKSKLKKIMEQLRKTNEQQNIKKTFPLGAGLF